jgi:hypothetical protein
MSSTNGRVPNARRLRQRKGETEEEFSVRKAKASREAAEQAASRRESEHAKKFPSDHPLQKFARVWDPEYQKEFK